METSFKLHQIVFKTTASIRKTKHNQDMVPDSIKFKKSKVMKQFYMITEYACMSKYKFYYDLATFMPWSVK